MLVITDMVQSRLKALIYERNTERVKQGKEPLNTRQIAEHAGIAHSTLTGLTANRMNGVKFGTLQALCRFFNCTPGDILEYVPEHEDFKPGSPAKHAPSDEELREQLTGLPAVQVMMAHTKRKLLQDPWLEVE